MIMRSKLVQAGFLAIMLLPAIAGYSIVAVHALEPKTQTKLCQIETTRQGNTILVKPMFKAKYSGSGRYQFAISNGVGVNISQGGEFLISAGQQQMLSQVSLSKSRSAYYANLQIMFDTKVIECQEIIK